MSAENPTPEEGTLSPTTVEGCWASGLGDCGGKLSAEHLLSSSLWTTPTISIEGLPWCRDEPKVVGLANLTSKILCQTHNTRLSPVDLAGANAFRALRRSSEIFAERGKQTPRKWKVQRLEIDGPGLERWLLKTAINLVASGQTKDGTWGLTGQPLEHIPPRLVQMAFGLEPITPPLGLYFLGNIGEQFAEGEHVNLATHLGHNEELIGVGFNFRGLRLYLSLLDSPLPPTLRLQHPREPSWRLDTPPAYHLQVVKYRLAKKLSHICHFMWPGKVLRPSDLGFP